MNSPIFGRSVSFILSLGYLPQTQDDQKFESFFIAELPQKGTQKWDAIFTDILNTKSGWFGRRAYIARPNLLDKSGDMPIIRL